MMMVILILIAVTKSSVMMDETSCRASEPDKADGSEGSSTISLSVMWRERFRQRVLNHQVHEQEKMLRADWWFCLLLVLSSVVIYVNRIHIYNRNPLKSQQSYFYHSVPVQLHFLAIKTWNDKNP